MSSPDPVILPIVSLVADARASLPAALAERQRRERSQGAACWRDPVPIGTALGLDRRALQAEILLAEQRGLIESKTIDAGPRITLSDLGWSLFGLDDRESRDPDPDDLRPSDPASSPGPAPRLDDWPDLIRALVAQRSAAVLVEGLAVQLGRDVEALWDEVLGLERGGAVETWPDHPAGPVAMLSSLTAERIGLRLAADGSRWLRAWEPDPTSIDLDWPDLLESDLDLDPSRPGLFDQWPDPDPLGGPEWQAGVEAAEAQVLAIEDLVTSPTGPRPLVQDLGEPVEDAWFGIECNRPVVRLPKPKLLLGLSLPWPVLAPGTEEVWRPTLGPCPGCLGRSLGVNAYCLVCHRSGLDALIRFLLTFERSWKSPRNQDRAIRDRSRRSSRRQASGQGSPGLRGGIGS